MAKRTFEHEYKSTQNYDYDIRPGETDLEYYRRLAKTADQRLVRLEKLAADREHPEFENVDKFAYARAMRDIEAYGGGRRFNVKPPEDRRQFNEKISDMLRFLQSPTSTKSGIIEVYEARVGKLNETTGLNMTWQEFAQIAETSGFEKMKEKDYGSDTIFQSIGQVQKSKEEIKETLDKLGRKNLTAKQAKEAGLLTNSPLDKGVKAILRDKRLLSVILNN